MTDGSPRAKRITAQIRTDNAEHNIGERTIIAHFDFNTQRTYTPQGQTIRVWFYSDGLVYFDDISRQIDGVFQIAPLHPYPNADLYERLERIVLFHYDRNKYTSGTVEMYDKLEKARRCEHRNIKRDATTYPNFLCLDCGSMLSAESVYEASTAALRSVE
jgi:hypothetical protein